MDCKYFYILQAPNNVVIVPDTKNITVVEGNPCKIIDVKSEVANVIEVRNSNTSGGGQGIPGPSGSKGDQGIPGPSGSKGDQGDPGPSGSKGDQGDPGPSGSKGDQGIPGPSGSKGDQGIPGPSGSKGDQGDQGPSGSKGDQGPSGSGIYNISHSVSYTFESPSNQIYRLHKIIEPISIVRAYSITATGSCVLTAKINTTNITGLISISGSSTENNMSATSNNSASGGSYLNLSIDSASSDLSMMTYTIVYYNV